MFEQFKTQVKELSRADAYILLMNWFQQGKTNGEEVSKYLNHIKETL